MSPRYRLNEPDVSAEVFDGEVLAIDLKSGHYHSIRGTGAALWNLLMAGRTADEATATLAAGFPKDAEVATKDAHTFIKELETSGLVVPVLSELPPSAAPEIPAASETVYAQPVLESYTDMQELLLIDPIHEVDVHTGWPQKAAS